VTTQPGTSAGVVDRPDEGAGTLSDVITTILDKGVVIDVYARVSLVGIELLRADARVVVASVDTYLRFAEAVNRLQLSTREPSGLPEITEDMSESGAKGKTKGALEAGAEKLSEAVGASDREGRERDTQRQPKRRSGS
jgi:gas vesicle structural protein